MPQVNSQSRKCAKWIAEFGNAYTAQRSWCVINHHSHECNLNLTLLLPILTVFGGQTNCEMLINFYCKKCLLLLKSNRLWSSFCCHGKSMHSNREKWKKRTIFFMCSIQKWLNSKRHCCCRHFKLNNSSMVFIIATKN